MDKSGLKNINMTRPVEVKRKMGRPKGARNKRSTDYLALYDKLAKRYGCPVQALFEIQSGEYEAGDRIRAATTLLSHRYPKLKAVEIQAETQTAFTFAWGSDAANE